MRFDVPDKTYCGDDCWIPLDTHTLGITLDTSHACYASYGCVHLLVWRIADVSGEVMAPDKQAFTKSTNNKST